MKWWQVLLAGIGIAAGGNAVWSFAREARKKREAFELAKALGGRKGILNLGSGAGRSEFASQVARSPSVVRNVGIEADGTPRYTRWDLNEPLPFGDGRFGAVFASHVLEHLENQELALTEMRRVGDCVVLVLPHPLSLPNWLHPKHRGIFGKDDLRRLEALPDVFVFY